MPNLITQPASDKNAQQNYINTVVNSVPLERMRPFIDHGTAQRLENLYRGKGIPVWGFTPVHENKWNKIEPGDVVLFLRNKFVFASSVISFKVHNPSLASELWGYDTKARTWEYVYFLDEVQNQRISYDQLNQFLGKKPGNNFQKAFMFNNEESDNLITVLDLESNTYETTPTREAYLHAIEPSEDVALDRVVNSKTRTEQSYLRYVNFGNEKYAECGVCGREYPVSFLVAAHIKKRSECTQQEKRDFKNITMPMCKFGCDELYEQGYIGVNNTVVVVHDENLSKSVLGYLSTVEGNQCKYWNDSTREYFEWHNERLKIAT